jgi:hypothetical protein
MSSVQKPDGYIYFILGAIILAVTIFGAVYQVEQQNCLLKIDSLTVRTDTFALQLEQQNKRIDTVYIILNSEVLRELKNNSNTMDSLGNSIQRLNIRTIPLVNYQP